MTEQELDTVYTRLCQTMTRLGEAQTPLFLARLALLAVERLGDAASAQALIDAAADNPASEPTGSLTSKAGTS